MKGKNLIALVNSGVKPIIEFNKETWELEYEPDIGMRARVNTVVNDGSGIWILACDLSEFESYNKQFETPSYFDKNGIPRLYWRETPYYPKDKVLKIYIGEEDDVIFNIIEQNALYSEYVESKSLESYIVWLENLVIESRDK